MTAAAYSVDKRLAHFNLEIGGPSDHDDLVALGEAIDRAASDNSVDGILIVLRGREGTHRAASLVPMPDEGHRKVIRNIEDIQRSLRSIETSGKPVAAVLQRNAGAAAMDIALACHCRVLANACPIDIRPVREAPVMLGGGLQRMTRILGVLETLHLFSEAGPLQAEKALEIGLVDAVAAESDLISRAGELLATKTAIRPWDEKGFKVPGADPRSYSGSLAFAAANASHAAKTFGRFPALDAARQSAHDGYFLPFGSALRVEARHLAKALMSPPVRTAVLRAEAGLALAGDVNSGDDAPAKIGVIGAGLMGSGIAAVVAAVGIEVCLIDSDREKAEAGRERIRKFAAREAERGISEASEIDRMMQNIIATDDFSELAGSEIVIEAVFEDREIKADVTRKIERVVDNNTLVASNTSTLPISGLAEACDRPGKFIGLHFFSPVQKMQLVEIIRGEKTTDESVDRALRFVKAIGKQAILVGDSRGFYTSRVFMTYTYEGIHMLMGGVKPALIENAGRMSGMPVAPLALCDAVGIDLMHHVAKQTKSDLGSNYRHNRVDNLLERLVSTGRTGKKSGKGFYDYGPDGPVLWDGLSGWFEPTDDQQPVEECVDQLLSIQSVEAARCLEEGVISTPLEADIGARLGWSYAQWAGGPMSYVDIVGLGEFVDRCDRFAREKGDRFEANRLLREMAENGTPFYGAGTPERNAA